MYNEGSRFVRFEVPYEVGFFPFFSFYFLLGKGPNGFPLSFCPFPFLPSGLCSMFLDTLVADGFIGLFDPSIWVLLNCY